MVILYDPKQLPLGVRLRADAQFSNFIPGDNGLLIDQLKTIAAGRNAETLAFVVGAPGSGRTHLLQACCHEAEAAGRTVFYLPLTEVAQLTPEMLESLENYALVCIDDLDAVAGQPDWELGLFHLFNRIRERGGALILAAASSPNQLPLNLEDLRSRLNWGLLFQLAELSEELKLQALTRNARERGLKIGDEVLHFMLSRAPRDLPALFGYLDALDQASLAEKRRITIPFVKQVLGWS